MCGIVGIVGFTQVNQSIYDALTVLQHQGQDAAGIATIDSNNGFRLRKANGLVKDVFETRHMLRLQGTLGIGHVRYPTAGSSSASEAQPFYVNSPFGITLAHNGNLTNAHTLKHQLFETARRHVNTTSDSEILLNVLAYELDRFDAHPLEPDNIFAAVSAMHTKIRGAYACVALIIGHGLLAFRDPNGIRPLVLASVLWLMAVKSTWSRLKVSHWIPSVLNICGMWHLVKRCISRKPDSSTPASVRQIRH